MSETKPDSSDELELKRKLLAAFGSEAMNDLDDDFDAELSDDFLNEALNATDSSNIGELVSDGESASVANGLNVNEEDSVRTQWMKQLCSAIYFPAGDSQSSTSAQYVVFAVGEFTFGIHLDSVCEIGRCPQVTQLPCTPAWLRGVANFRGEVHSVTDFRNLVRIKDQRPTVGEMVVVIRSSRSQSTTALTVDQVIGIQKLEQVEQLEQVETGLANFEQFSSVASGILQNDSANIILVDSELILEAADLTAPTPA